MGHALCPPAGGSAGPGRQCLHGRAGAARPGAGRGAGLCPPVRGTRRADRVERGAGADADPGSRVFLAPGQPPLPGGELHSRGRFAGLHPGTGRVPRRVRARADAGRPHLCRLHAGIWPRRVEGDAPQPAEIAGRALLVYGGVRPHPGSGRHSGLRRGHPVRPDRGGVRGGGAVAQPDHAERRPGDAHRLRDRRSAADLFRDRKL